MSARTGCEKDEETMDEIHEAVGDTGTQHSRERDLADLTRALSTDSIRLVRQELALLRAEANGKLERAQEVGVWLGAGAAIVAVGALVLVASAVLALALVLPAWAAALVVGAVLVVGGFTALAYGRTRLERASMTPDKTVRSVRHAARTFREAMG